ncbi:MAG: methyltransferase domain-containing protein [Pirellulales bacterium]|nr:methyltransferase domain-containing protein [Pirellulales bacterium]
MADSSTANTTYEPFSRDPAYLEANREFVARLPLQNVRRILDLACGTGTVGEMLLAAAPQASLYGVDLDPVQIELAAQQYAQAGYKVHRVDLGASPPPTGESRHVTLAVGTADELPLGEGTFDCVTIANAIHLIDDKGKLLAAAARVLAPGGIFAFNSGFYAGCYPPGTELAFYEWVKEATAWIEQYNADRVAAGEAPARRVRGTTRGAFQNRWLNPSEWQDMLVQAGFEVRDVHERTVVLNPTALAAIGAYGGMAKVALSGYPVELASQALEASVGKALENCQLTSVPRNWLEICAVRRAS